MVQTDREACTHPVRLNNPPDHAEEHPSAPYHNFCLSSRITDIHLPLLELASQRASGRYLV